MENTFFGCHEAANFLGISKSQLYKLTSGKQIPHYKPTGKLLRFSLDELTDWIKSAKVSPISKTAQGGVTSHA